MSRIGKAPITVPAGVDVTVDGRRISVKGPKGTLEHIAPPSITIARDGDDVVVTRPDDERENRAPHGLTRSLVANMVQGVSEGYERELEIVGVGYRATAQGPSKIELQVGYSHPVSFDAPEGIERMGSAEAVFDQRLRVLAAIEDLPKPVIAVLCGYCLGGGLELPLACHFRLAAAEGARIGLPELDLGTVPAWGGSARLTRRVGRDHALDLILRAKKISGPEALRIGLVHEVWPLGELFARAHALAHELAEKPAVAVAGVLRSVVGAGERSLAEGIAAERRAVMSTMGTPDQREGIMAFLEKRAPRFNRDA
jgi:enoyl-CoA hydratase